jgi:hypothetical protein
MDRSGNPDPDSRRGARLHPDALRLVDAMTRQTAHRLTRGIETALFVLSLGAVTLFVLTLIDWAVKMLL